MIDFKSKFGRFALKHIKSEYFVWLTTVDSSGTPQPKPVWFIWDEAAFLVFSQAKARKVQHIQNNPHVSLHFNTADEKGEKRLIVFTGNAEVDSDSPPADRMRAYLRKYRDGIRDLSSTPAEFAQEYSIAIRIHPTKVRGWE